MIILVLIHIQKYRKTHIYNLLIDSPYRFLSKTENASPSHAMCCSTGLSFSHIPNNIIIVCFQACSPKRLMSSITVCSDFFVKDSLRGSTSSNACGPGEQIFTLCKISFAFSKFDVDHPGVSTTETCRPSTLLCFITHCLVLLWTLNA